MSCTLNTLAGARSSIHILKWNRKCWSILHNKSDIYLTLCQFMFVISCNETNFSKGSNFFLFLLNLNRLNVSLYTDGGESPGALTTCTTLQDRPESVTSLDISERGRTYVSLNVTWNPPTVTNGILLCKL